MFESRAVAASSVMEKVIGRNNTLASYTIVIIALVKSMKANFFGKIE
jgi:hypothetical protein